MRDNVFDIKAFQSLKVRSPDEAYAEALVIELPALRNLPRQMVVCDPWEEEITHKQYPVYPEQGVYLGNPNWGKVTENLLLTIKQDAEDDFAHPAAELFFTGMRSEFKQVELMVDQLKAQHKLDDNFIAYYIKPDINLDRVSAHLDITGDQCRALIKKSEEFFGGDELTKTEDIAVEADTEEAPLALPDLNFGGDEDDLVLPDLDAFMLPDVVSVGNSS